MFRFFSLFLFSRLALIAVVFFCFVQPMLVRASSAVLENYWWMRP
jgi:hypothetical protein